MDVEIPVELAEAGGRINGCVLELASGGRTVAEYLHWHTPQADAVATWLAERGSPVGLLYMVEVEDEFRGQGLGNSLLAQFLERAKACGASEVLLLSDGEEEQLEGFELAAWYERHGFEAVHQSASSGCILMASAGDFAAKLRDLHESNLLEPGIGLY